MRGRQLGYLQETPGFAPPPRGEYAFSDAARIGSSRSDLNGPQRLATCPNHAGCRRIGKGPAPQGGLSSWRAGQARARPGPLLVAVTRQPEARMNMWISGVSGRTESIPPGRAPAHRRSPRPTGGGASPAQAAAFVMGHLVAALDDFHQSRDGPGISRARVVEIVFVSSATQVGGCLRIAWLSTGLRVVGDIGDCGRGASLPWVCDVMRSRGMKSADRSYRPERRYPSRTPRKRVCRSESTRVGAPGWLMKLAAILDVAGP
jgi:hypothetical protein